MKIRNRRASLGLWQAAGKAGGAVKQNVLYSAKHREQCACMVIRGERPAAAGVF